MDMSFSGILSHVEALAKKMKTDDEEYKCNLCYSLQGLCSKQVLQKYLKMA